MKQILFTISLFMSLLHSEGKQLIIAEGNGWFPHMPKNLIAQHDYVSKLPFSGFTMVGNSYTDKVMERNKKVTYKSVWEEVKGLNGLYEKKENFLQVNIHFPGDFWDDKAWEQVNKNFEVVAEVAKDIGFKGIIFDDEPYSKSAQKMINFKFPTKSEIAKHNKKYAAWEKKGSEAKWVDEDAYRNPKYTFKEHINKVTSRFKEIMSRAVKKYPDLTMLVYLGPALSHENSNKNYPIIIDLGLPRNHEFHGAMFTGLKQGLSKDASLHDMGESYKYRKNKHFGNAYQWRKQDIAKDKYNDDLNASYHWVVPKSERKSWEKEVGVGFMVFNIGQKSTYDEYTTLDTSSVKDIGETLKKALHYSDKYVIYYCHEQAWLNPKKKYHIEDEWMKMMKEVYLTTKK
jgi:hypothetical protein